MLEGGVFSVNEFVTGGDVLILPEVSSALGRDLLCEVPFDTATMNGTDVLVGLSISSY